MAILDLLVWMVALAFLEHLAFLDPMDSLGFQDQWDSQAPLGLREVLGLWVVLELLVRLAQRDSQAVQVCLACQVRLDGQVWKVYQVGQDLVVQLESMASLEVQDCQDLKDHQVDLVLPEPPALLVVKDSRVRRDQQVLLD